MKEALKLALEALKGISPSGVWTDKLVERHEKAITAIKEALAQPEQRSANEHLEPVAWAVIASNTGRMCQVELDFAEVEELSPKWVVPLYTTPPQRDSSATPLTWVGLTDEEVEEVWEQVESSDFLDCVHPLSQAIEAKLKEKNT